MAQDKKSFLFYCDWKDTFESLGSKNGYELLMHVLRYVNDENPQTENEIVKAIFPIFKNQLKRDLDRWEDKIEKRSDAGNISAGKRAFKKWLNENDTSKLSSKEHLNEAGYCIRKQPEHYGTYMFYYYDEAIKYHKKMATKLTSVESVEQESTKSTVIVKDNVKDNVIKELNYIPSNQKDFQVEDIEVSFEVIKNINIEKEKNSKKKGYITLEFNQEIQQCYFACLEYFTEDLIPTELNQVSSWMDTIDKLHRLEHLQYSDIVILVKAVRNDPFWAKNFLSLTKLRRKDKDKIPYWKVFAEKFKQEKTKTEKTYDAYEEARKSMNL